jgi:DNA repair protein RadD
MAHPAPFVAIAPSVVQLRKYQRIAFERLTERIEAGVRRLVVVSPTGSGKTVLGAHVVAEAIRVGRRVLFVAHRREIIDQTRSKLLAYGLGDGEVGVIMASDPRRRPGAMVQVASIDTLRHRSAPGADLVIVDECHRAVSPSYRRLQDSYPDATHLGLTATPYRADGRGLGAAYDEILVVASPKELIAQGHLVAPRIFTAAPDDLPDLSHVKVRGGDFDERALADAMDRTPLVGNLVEHWQKYASDLRTVVFATSIAHSHHIIERFRAAGVAAEHLDGETPTAERDAILARVARGETRVISNVGVLCEGTDIVSLKCCALARPTMSTGLYLQQVGRIMRPWNNERAVILDHAGCVLRLGHGRPDDDREFSLDDRKKRGGSREPSEATAKPCPGCDEVLAAAVRSCPGCGHVFASDEPVPEEQGGELIEVGSLDPHRARWDELCAEAGERGYHPGWARHRFRGEFGFDPPSSFTFTKGRGRRPIADVADIAREAARRGGQLSWSQFTSPA